MRIRLKRMDFKDFPHLTRLTDEENRLVTFTGALGLTSFSATVCKSGSNKLSLLLDGDKLLSLVSLVGSYSNSTTVKTLSSLLGSYDGMKVGMELSK